VLKNLKTKTNQVFIAKKDYFFSGRKVNFKTKKSEK